MEINSNKSEPLAKIVNSPVTSLNFDDFRKIIMAMVLPQQVMVDIEYDNGENVMLSGVAGLMANMFFSTTPGFRTITLRSARETDVIIGRMLSKLGYKNDNQNQPLNVTPQRGGPNVWLELETHDFDGLGWCNSRTNEVYVINDALYDGINELPIYVGLDQYVDIQDLVDFNDVPRPPILNDITRCLADAARTKNRADAVQSLFSYVAPKWSQFFFNLNRFIVTYGETGFREIPINCVYRLKHLARENGFNSGSISYSKINSG
ncbi:unnamed protein product [Phaedon cochleariae]|uniref:Uncharacterized protein n=1 Tax=Phaedon cochleariae TaxID=80249 RepID=A0A9P0GU06_PHACE|nr:unnamed protein product [Phaedon cochleariae]